MLDYEPLDKELRDRKVSRRRILIALAVMILCAGVLCARLFVLQIVRHEHFTTLSANNRIRIIPIPPPRGRIYDRSGYLLASNVLVHNLEAQPEIAGSARDIARKLSEIINLAEEDIELFEQAVRTGVAHGASGGFVVKRELRHEEIARFMVNRHLLHGLDIATGYKRHYPLSEAASHLLGYVSSVTASDLDGESDRTLLAIGQIGKQGIEKRYERLLRGELGFRQVEVNATGRVIRLVKTVPPRPGTALYLNVDRDLQNTAYEALAGEKGAVVAIEPATGAVLALASAPGFDANLFVDNIEPAVYNDMLEDRRAPLVNRAVRGQYPPGSTLKPFLSLASLDFRVRDPHDETWCPGWFRLSGRSQPFFDWKREGHGTVDLSSAIARSCDVYFYRLALELGVDRMSDFLQRFGLGAVTGIDLDGEKGGLVPSSDWKRRVRNEPWFPGETAIFGIGQGDVLTTPVQLAAATATLAMEGRRHKPRILAGIRPYPEPVIEWLAPDELSQVSLLEREHWGPVRAGMIGVVHGERGTARAAGRGLGYPIAGKTGTAQVVRLDRGNPLMVGPPPKKFQDHALFIAYAPAHEPRIAVAVVVENGGSGSRTAAPIARRLIEHRLNPPAG